MGFISKSHLRFRISLKQGEKVSLDDQKKPCSWTSDPINALGVDAVGRPGDSRIPGTNIWAEKPNLRANEVIMNERQSAGMRGVPNA